MTSNYYGMGGTQVFIKEFARRMVVRGHHVDILSHTKLSQPRKRSFKSKDNYRVFFTLPSLRIPKVPHSHLITYFLAPQRFLAGIRGKYDVIHAQSEVDAYSAIISRWWHKIPVSCRVSGVLLYICSNDLKQNYGSGFWVKAIIRYLRSIQLHVLSKSDGVTTITEQQYDILKRYYSFPDKDLELIHHGIDVDRFSPKNIAKFRKKMKQSLGLTGRVLVFTGRFTTVRRVHLQILALKDILQEFPDVQLVLFGKDDNLTFNDYKMLARENGVENSLVYGGSIPHSRIHEALSVADIFLDTAFANGLGFSQLEALSCGIPLVSVQTLDIHDSPLVSVEPTPTGVATGVKKLLGDKEFFKNISQNSRDYINKHHSWDKIIKDYEDHLRQVIKGN